jgi:hypothetical protein
MTHTIEEIARLCGCGPEEKPGWWKYKFVGDNASGCSISGDDSMVPDPNWQPTGEYCGPGSTHRKTPTDLDLFAFQHVRPVLLAAGCVIEDDGSRAGERDVFVYKGVELLVECAEYSHALFDAILRLHETCPDVLAEAVAKVKEVAQ